MFQPNASQYCAVLPRLPQVPEDPPPPGQLEPFQCRGNLDLLCIEVSDCMTSGGFVVLSTPPEGSFMTIPLEDIVFMGRDGYECEEFIRAIHKVAYAAGRIRDDAWMADLALACFSGKALRFYQSLGPEVQCNWQLLRPALLTKYARPENDDDELLSEGLRTPQIAETLTT